MLKIKNVIVVCMGMLLLAACDVAENDNRKNGCKYGAYHHNHDGKAYHHKHDGKAYNHNHTYCN